MTFKEDYTTLEREFCEQVEQDRKRGIESRFLHNTEPKSPVDFVLIGQEPSRGPNDCIRNPPPGKSKPWRNFAVARDNYILHFCAMNYLCQEGETYYITDLRKGQMYIKDAYVNWTKRTDEWFPLLKKELRLVAKPGQARIIALGRKVQNFLNPQKRRKYLCEQIERVPHFSGAAAWVVNKEVQKISCWEAKFEKFRDEFDGGTLEESIMRVLKEADMDEYICEKLKGAGDKHRLTKSKRLMKLAFLYKHKFKELRTRDDIILNIE